jgi:hypothetical protein
MTSQPPDGQMATAVAKHENNMRAAISQALQFRID